jgi:hypothetical protein
MLIQYNKLFLLKFYFHFIPLKLGCFRIKLDGLFHLGLYRVLVVSRKKSNTRLMLDIITQFCVLVGNDHDSCFWSDVWLGGNCLVIQFPRIFSVLED